MIIYFATALGISVLGMSVILLRHIPKTQHGPKTSLAVPESNGATTLAMLTAWVDRVELWMKAHILPTLVSLISKIIVFIERMALNVSARALKTRRALFRKSQAQPRESLYWRTISHWRNEEKGNDDTTDALPIRDADQDVSHHPQQ